MLYRNHKTNKALRILALLLALVCVFTIVDPAVYAMGQEENEGQQTEQVQEDKQEQDSNAGGGTEQTELITAPATVRFHLPTAGAHLLEILRYPSLNSTGQIAIAVQVDGGTPVLVESPTTDEYRGNWSRAVVQNAEGDDSIAIRSMMYLFLSYDHRLVDGGDAARFLTFMKKRLEDGAFEAELGL